MENWGLITYRTTAILFDEKESDAKYKNRVAYVVAHELAHQWFGNLVTMDWWSEVCSLLFEVEVTVIKLICFVSSYGSMKDSQLGSAGWQLIICIQVYYTA